MSPYTSTRLAWSVAVASLALWATSTPTSWGQASGGTPTVDQTTSINVTTLTTTMSLQDAPDAAPPEAAPDTGGDGTSAPWCLPLPAPAAQTTPPPSSTTMPSPSGPSAQEGTFHLCGADPQAEQAIEQLIAGRSFSTSLTARGDGCADLTVRVTGQNAAGSATSNLSVSLGSGQTLSIQIVSERGATRVSIGAGR